jgi:predicted ATPase
MLKKLTLERFKNFRKAELTIGPLTLLVGTNASGKSNLRDAFRFLHGISRGYSLADIIGEKWVEGGVLQWRGIRGGTREVGYPSEQTFGVVAEVVVERLVERYTLQVDIGDNGRPPRAIRESLYRGERMVFDSHPDDDSPGQGDDPVYVFVRLPRDAQNRKHGRRLQFVSAQPALSQMMEHRQATKEAKASCEAFIGTLASMRFLDLSVDAMRMPSIPGQIVLGDRGENLSSVLQAICEDPKRKAALIRWIQELTPMDAQDFEFPADQTGRILVSLLEGKGRRISAYSASDGTLRFLAMVAALLGPEPARFYFFEELENGIHPTRLHLLIQLIEKKVAEGTIQMVATTHSPHLLALLNAESRENASLVYRGEESPDARIVRIMDLPTAREVVEKQDLAKLYSSGWLEDTVAFTEEGAQQ